MLWLVVGGLVVAVGFVALCLRLGAVLIGVHVEAARCLGLAAALVTLTLVCWILGYLVESGGHAPAMLILALAPVLALAVVKRALAVGWPKALVVWTAQGVGQTVVLAVLAWLLVGSGEP